MPNGSRIILYGNPVGIFFVFLCIVYIFDILTGFPFGFMKIFSKNQGFLPDFFNENYIGGIRT